MDNYNKFLKKIFKEIDASKLFKNDLKLEKRSFRNEDYNFTLKVDKSGNTIIADGYYPKLYIYYRNELKQTVEMDKLNYHDLNNDIKLFKVNLKILLYSLKHYIEEKG